MNLDELGRYVITFKDEGNPGKTIYAREYSLENGFFWFEGTFDPTCVSADLVASVECEAIMPYKEAAEEQKVA